MSSFPRRELKSDYQRQQASLRGGLAPRPFFTTQGKWSGEQVQSAFLLFIGYPGLFCN